MTYCSVPLCSLLAVVSSASGQLDEGGASAAGAALLTAGEARGPVGDRVPEGMFTLTDVPTFPNGCWCWYEDERALVDSHDPDDPLLLVGTVSSAPEGHPECGDIDVLWRRLGTGVQGGCELADRLESDDHDSAVLYLRPDGRYVALYSMHGTDHLTRWRVSTRPHDPTDWAAERTRDNGAGTTYNNTYHLPGDNGGAGRTYNFTRTRDRDPHVQLSPDHGATWKTVGRLLHEHWPYLRYASRGERIHLIATESHPHEFQNGIYHGFVRDGALHDSFGTAVDRDVFDPEAVGPQALTPVFCSGSVPGGTTMYRAWTIDLAVDAGGQPVAIFSARAEDDREDHRFFYARFDGSRWDVRPLARAGGFLYEGQWDYTGLVAIDPDAVDAVFLSSEVDPRSGEPTERYELYRGRTDDRGATWTWTALTEHSSVDNLRPIVPAWNTQRTVVLWLRGSYVSYTQWDTEVVGCVLEGAPETSEH